jgi:hypothetical protein
MGPGRAKDICLRQVSNWGIIPLKSKVKFFLKNEKYLDLILFFLFKLRLTALFSPYPKMHKAANYTIHNFNRKQIIKLNAH